MNDSGPSPHESPSAVVSPETTQVALAAATQKLEGIPVAPNGTTYAEFDTTDEEGNQSWLRIRQIPIELSSDGVVLFVYGGRGHESPSNHYFFVSTAEGVSLEHHGSYESPQLTSDQTETLDDAVEAILADRNQVWEEERRAGLASVHEAEAQNLLESIKKAKLRENYRPDEVRGRRVSAILGRLFKK